VKTCSTCQKPISRKVRSGYCPDCKTALRQSGFSYVRDIVRVAATVFMVPAHQIYAPTRKRPINRARKAVYLVAREAGLSTPVIGEVLGLDHTSVVVGSRVAREWLERDEVFAALIHDLRQSALHGAPVQPRTITRRAPAQREDRQARFNRDAARGSSDLLAALEAA
jgi:hypothetical protein